MIPITYNGSAAWLLDDAPNWATPVEFDAEIPGSFERGITARETRRATRDSVRLTVRWKAHVVGAAAVTNLRNSLRSLQTEPVLCPFWPGWVSGTQVDSTPLGMGNVILLDGISAPTITAQYNGPFSRDRYPLLVGYLKTPPNPVMISDTLAEVDFEFQESDGSAWQVAGFNGDTLSPTAYFSQLTGTFYGSEGKRLFPFTAEWSKTPVSGGADRDIVRQEIGELRTFATQYFTQPGRRRLEQSFVLNYPLDLLNWFILVGGQCSPFWLPCEITEANLTADVTGFSNVLHVDNGAALSAGDSIILDTGGSRSLFNIVSVSGNQWTLDNGVWPNVPAAGSRIQQIILARFESPKLTVSVEAPNFARSTIKFRELPAELVGASAGETIGTTMGALPTTAMLFKFWQTTPSGTTYWYFTSFERLLNDGVNFYNPQPIEAGTIKETDNLERQTVTIKSRNFSGNPLALLIPFQLEFPLQVAIYEGDVQNSWNLFTSTVSNLRCYYSGEVTKCDVEPPYITAECSSMSAIFDRNIPRRLYQPGCNWVLFETNCGLLAANWLWTAVVVSYDAASCTLVVGTIASSNGATITAHFFSAGYLSITTSGATANRMIGDNLVPSAGQMTIYLAQPLFTAPTVGDAVKIFPGCDGQASTCSGRFGNYSKFGGFPFMPVGNPSVLRITNNAGSGGKK